MSRINDNYECDDTASFLRGCAFEANAHRALFGKKGQRFLRELEAALLAMPEKRLSDGRLARTTVVGTELVGECCALGAVALQREVAAGTPRPVAMQELALVSKPDDEDDESYDGWEMTGHAADILGIVKPLAWTVVCANDEYSRSDSPEDRWQYMLKWARSRIRPMAGWFTFPAPAETNWRL
jgi:hypothetical protein